MLTELAIHAAFIRRIRHQFRASKIIHRSQAIQQCSRRLHRLQGLRFRDELFSAGRSFAEGGVALLNRISDVGKLISQLARYAELVAETSTQSLAQEYYFIFGTDLSILATTSRIWAIAKALYSILGNAWKRILTCLLDSGVEKKKFRAIPDIFPGLVENSVILTDEILPPLLDVGVPIADPVLRIKKKEKNAHRFGVLEEKKLDDAVGRSFLTTAALLQRTSAVEQSGALARFFL